MMPIKPQCSVSIQVFLECSSSTKKKKNSSPVQITDKVQKLAWSAGVYLKAQFSRKVQNVVQVCAVLRQYRIASGAVISTSAFEELAVGGSGTGQQREVLSGWVVRSIGQISVIMPGSEFNLVLSAELLHRHPADRDHGQGECSESLSSERGLGASYLRDAFQSLHGIMQQHGTFFSFLEQSHKLRTSHSQFCTFTMHLQITFMEI